MGDDLNTKNWLTKDKATHKKIPRVQVRNVRAGMVGSSVSGTVNFTSSIDTSSSCSSNHHSRVQIFRRTTGNKRVEITIAELSLNSNCYHLSKNEPYCRYPNCLCRLWRAFYFGYRIHYCILPASNLHAFNLRISQNGQLHLKASADQRIEHRSEKKGFASNDQVVRGASI